MTNHELLTLTHNTLLKSAQIQARAIARARVVQAEINDLRAALSTAAPRPFRDAGNFYEDFPNAAVLASLDAEMTRLCALPGVLDALLGDEVTP